MSDEKRQSAVPSENQLGSKKDGSDLENGNIKSDFTSDDAIGTTDAISDLRTMSKWNTLFVLITNQLGLGVLSLPGTFKTLGIVPALITHISFGLVSWYGGIVMYETYLRYPYVRNIVEMTRATCGPWGEWAASILLFIQLLMTGASASVTLSIVFNTLSEHSICTVAFIGIACLINFVLCIPRTMKFVSHSGLPCVLGILFASLVLMIGLGVKGPRTAPEGFELASGLVAVAKPNFREGFSAIVRIFFAYAAGFSFPSYMAEMKDPARDFLWSIKWMFIISMCIYTSIALTVYVLAGDYVVSPALGAAPLVYAKASYGIVIPSILSTGMAVGHIGTKTIHIQVMSRLKLAHETTSNTIKSWASWLTACTLFWIISFIIANAIPVFDSILSITSCTTASWNAWGFTGLFWLHINKGNYFSSWKQRGLFAFNVGFVLATLFMNSAGLWASITELLDKFKSGDGVRGCFDCGDNSQ